MPTFKGICKALGLNQEHEKSIYESYRGVLVISLDFNVVPVQHSNTNGEFPIEIELFPKIIKSFIDALVKQADLSDYQEKELQKMAEECNLPPGCMHTSEAIKDIHNKLLDFI